MSVSVFLISSYIAVCGTGIALKKTQCGDCIISVYVLMLYGGILNEEV
uniref:Uncharacterized protein n=1 Tax=Anguilla anguilla TaxID=7936 RepID=A0A0E9P6G2_ANGAN